MSRNILGKVNEREHKSQTEIAIYTHRKVPQDNVRQPRRVRRGNESLEFSTSGLDIFVYHVYIFIVVVPSNSGNDYGFVDDMLSMSRRFVNIYSITKANSHTLTKLL